MDLNVWGTWNQKVQKNGLADEVEETPEGASARDQKAAQKESMA